MSSEMTRSGETEKGYSVEGGGGGVEHHKIFFGAQSHRRFKTCSLLSQPCSTSRLYLLNQEDNYLHG